MTAAKKKTAKKTAKKKTSAKAKPPAKKVSRAAKIRSILERAKDPKTVREICDDLKLGAENAKFVSSILINQKKNVVCKKKACPITGRTVNAFSLRRGA